MPTYGSSIATMMQKRGYTKFSKYRIILLSIWKIGAGAYTQFSV